MERAAERHRDVAGAIPAQLDDGRFVAGDVERRGEPCRRGAGMKHEIAVGRRRRRAWRTSTPSVRASAARAGSMSMSVTSAPGIRPQRKATSAPTTPAPTTAMRSGRARARASQIALSAVSMLAASTARGGGMSSGTGTTASAGTVELGLMRMQREDIAADQRGRPGLDHADRRVAVFHREREAARP